MTGYGHGPPIGTKDVKTNQGRQLQHAAAISNVPNVTLWPLSSPRCRAVVQSPPIHITRGRMTD